MCSHATEDRLPDVHPILVIGFGNTLRRDDGAGPLVARHLARRLAAEHVSGIVALDVMQLVPELSEDIRRSKCVIFIDASIAVPAGRLAITRVDPHPELKCAGRLGHHESPERLLALCEKVFGEAPPAFVLAIGAASLNLGWKLSRNVKPVVHELVNHLYDGLVHKGQDSTPHARLWQPWHNHDAPQVWKNLFQAASAGNPFIGKGII